jgi:hypothetical protein
MFVADKLVIPDIDLFASNINDLEASAIPNVDKFNVFRSMAFP